MAFSLKYIPIVLNYGNRIYRPLIPLILEGKRKRDIVVILDPGSDISIIPKEIANFLELELFNRNEVFGISRTSLLVKEGKVKINFGTGGEIYNFEIPILVPDQEDVPLIIGRAGFFNEFKITFIESERKISFEKFQERFI